MCLNILWIIYKEWNNKFLLLYISISLIVQFHCKISDSLRQLFCTNLICMRIFCYNNIVVNYCKIRREYIWIYVLEQQTRKM
jgi:hypothetical protein